MIVNRIESNNAKKDGAKAAALEAFVVALGEAEAAQVAFADEDADDSNKGLTVMVVLFAHWSEGNRVALALNVISAHCWSRSQPEFPTFDFSSYAHCITLHHFSG